MYFLKYGETLKKLKDGGYITAFDKTRQATLEFRKKIYFDQPMDESISELEKTAVTTSRANFFNDFVQDDEPILKLDAQALAKIDLKVSDENMLLVTYQNNRLTLFEVEYYYIHQIGSGTESKIFPGRDLETGENVAIKSGCDHGFSNPCYMGWKLAQKKFNSSPYFVQTRALGQICLPIQTETGVKVELFQPDYRVNAILVMERIQKSTTEFLLSIDLDHGMVKKFMNFYNIY